MTAAWKSIESAPKDGTPVLIYRPTAKLPEDRIRVDWFNREVGAWWHCPANRQPTHWMDLPDPPAEGT